MSASSAATHETAAISCARQRHTERLCTILWPHPQDKPAGRIHGGIKQENEVLKIAGAENLHRNLGQRDRFSGAAFTRRQLHKSWAEGRQKGRPHNQVLKTYIDPPRVNRAHSF